MKSTNLLAIASIALASPIGQARAKFVQVAFEPPLNWLPGPSLFPSKIIAGYHAGLAEYNATSWADSVLQKCMNFSACTSTSSYSAINSGSNGGRYWFGGVYRGGPTTIANYSRDNDPNGGVESATAYTIVA